MARNQLHTTGGLFKTVAASTLVVPTGGGSTPPPPSSDTYPWRLFSSTTSPWNVKINWTTATTSTPGRTPAQLYGQTGHAYLSNDVSGAFIFYEDSGSINWNIFNQKTGQNVSMRAPSNLAPANNNTDYNAQVVSLSGIVYDIYQLTINSTGNATASGIRTSSATGPGFGLNNGHRAAHFPWAAGCVTLDDWNNGIIPHALVVALGGDDLRSPLRRPAYGEDAGGYSTTNGGLQQGTLLGIRPSTPKPSGMSVIGSLMWDAHRDYGVYVGDRTGGWNWYGNWGPQRRLPNSVIEAMRSAPYDGDKIVSNLVVVTNGKPTIADHA